VPGFSRYPIFVKNSNEGAVELVSQNLKKKKKVF
jgi:hypothetical protein